MQLHRLECSSMSQVLNTICQGQKKLLTWRNVGARGDMKLRMKDRKKKTRICLKLPAEIRGGEKE